jgi:hypothetical protein
MVVEKAFSTLQFTSTGVLGVTLVTGWPFTLKESCTGDGIDCVSARLYTVG